MPSPIVPNAVKVSVRGELFGQEVLNVWGCVVGTAPTPTELLGIAAIFQTRYADLLGQLSSDLSISEITCRYLGAAEGPEATLVITPAMTGGQAAAPSSPSNVCLCVSLRSGLAGRRFRGRKYFSGIPEGFTADNLIGIDVCDSIVEAINALITDLAGNSTPLAIVSIVQLAATEVITALCVDRFVDSQRRRLSGRGR